MGARPLSFAVPDPVALGIAGLFRSPVATGHVMDYLFRTGTVDSGKLILSPCSRTATRVPRGMRAVLLSTPVEI
jgi:hypothetical protein